MAVSRFEVRVVVTGPPPWPTVEARPHADGVDLLAPLFDAGPATDPDRLLAPGGPIEATDQPREVRLAEAECVEDCCGALYVTVTRAGGEVVWHRWRDPARGRLAAPEVRFDADQYALEVARAAADRTWEWPARTVARLVETALRQRADWLNRWPVDVQGVAPAPGDPDRLVLRVFHPKAPAGGGEPWLQFEVELPVTAGPPPEQARRLVDWVTAADPRAAGRICGGSREFAAALGYPWPPNPGRRPKPTDRRRKRTGR